MRPRKSTLYCYYIVVHLVVILVMLGHTHRVTRLAMPKIEVMAAMVQRLQLTDLCLFTDARYTRNPSLADRHSAFQDSPMSLEHFPSGSLMPPPPHLQN